MDASTTDASTRQHQHQRPATTNTSAHATTNTSTHTNTNNGTNASATQEPTPASATAPTPAARTPAPASGPTPARWQMGQDKLDDERPNTNTTANGPPPAR